MNNRFSEWQYPEIVDGQPTKYNWIVQNIEKFNLGYKTDIGAFSYINAKYGVDIEEFVQTPPHMSGREIDFIKQAFESNYIAPIGTQVVAFEKEFCKKVGVEHAVALSSGTAAIHLALRGLKVRSDDIVFASTLTFIGSVTPVIFQGATPVFIDCERKSCNLFF